MNLLDKAREALKPLWEKSHLRGTCWGPKEGNNPYTGTNIFFAVGKEAVAVSQRGDTLTVYEFARSENTSLGRKVKALLSSIKEQPLVMKDGEAIPMTDYMWCCFVCKKRGGVDSADDDRITANKIIEAHRTASPRCHPALEQFKVYRNFVEEKGLEEILTLEPVRSQ